MPAQPITSAHEGAGDAAAEWRARYFGAGGSIPPQLEADSEATLAELAQLQRQPRAVVLARLLFAHAHGRLRLEQLCPSQATGAERSPERVSGALLADLATLASRQGIAADAYTRGAVAAELGGALGADASAEIGEAAWREDEASFKVWLPAALDAAVKELAALWDVTASDVVRNLLLTHLYGRLGYWRTVRSGVWQACRRQFDIEDIALSRRQRPISEAPRTQFIREFGKSDAGFRLWCPAPMKLRIAEAATAAGVKASEYSRRVLVDAVLGRLEAAR